MKTFDISGGSATEIAPPDGNRVSVTITGWADNTADRIMLNFRENANGALLAGALIPLNRSLTFSRETHGDGVMGKISAEYTSVAGTAGRVGVIDVLEFPD